MPRVIEVTMADDDLINVFITFGPIHARKEHDTYDVHFVLYCFIAARHMLLFRAKKTLDIVIFTYLVNLCILNLYWSLN